jgi:hypothetical protein
LDKLFNIVKQLEVERRSNSQMLKRDTNSNNSMRARRRLSFAETLRCTVTASTVTPAHTLMALISFKRRHIFQAIL